MLSRAVSWRGISTRYLSRCLATASVSPAPDSDPVTTSTPNPAPAATNDKSPAAAADSASASAPSPTSETTNTDNGVIEDRLHSTDIAFKPNSDGWGFSRQYASKYDSIFNKKNKNGPTTDDSTVPENKLTVSSKRSTLFDGGRKTGTDLVELKAQILALPVDQRRRLLDEVCMGDLQD